MKKKFFSAIMALSALAVLVASLFFPWATVDGRMELDVMGMQAGVDIEVDFFPHQFTFDVETDVPEGGLLGGMDRNISESRYYTEGLEGFGAIGGVLYKAPNPAEYTINILPASGGRASIQVSLNREAPLWWPAGLEEVFTVTMELKNMTNVSEVRITSVQFWLYTGYNETKASSNTIERLVPFDKRQPFPEKSIGEVFSMVGDTFVHEEKITVRDFHERFGIAVDVSYEAEADDGSITTVGSSYPGNHPPASHQLQITQMQSVRVFMLGATFPLLILTLIIGAVAAGLSMKEHPHTRHLLFITGIMAVLCTVFFWAGASVFLELLDIVEPWFSFTHYIFIPLISGGLLFGSFIVERTVEREEFVEFVVEEENTSDDLPPEFDSQ